MLASSGAGSAAVLAACAEPSFIFEPVAAAPPPVKTQRLLLWLPPDDKFVDWPIISAQLAAALAPYGVAVETGRSNRLELSRSDDQKALIEKFNPTYRLEIDGAGAASAGSGSSTASSIVLVGVLYRGAGRTPLAKFQHHARSKRAPQLVPQVVDMLRKGGYL